MCVCVCVCVCVRERDSACHPLNLLSVCQVAAYRKVCLLSAHILSYMYMYKNNKCLLTMCVTVNPVLISIKASADI